MNVESASGGPNIENKILSIKKNSEQQAATSGMCDRIGTSKYDSAERVAGFDHFIDKA
jgi:hypothetical protein